MRDELDSAAKLFLFFPIRPLALMDMAGLDTCVLGGNA